MRLSHSGLLVFKACLDRPGQNMYGYELMQLTGLASGTLYPLLTRFENEGWLTSSWEKTNPQKEGRPRRRLYRLTGSGQIAACGFMTSLGMEPAL